MTSMVFLGVFIFGLLSWTQLPRELFPNISVPQLVIITKYPNAAPEEIENLITKPIEEGIGTVPNLKRVRSISKEGISAVKMEFRWGTDMGFAHLAAREKLDRMKDRLPQEAEEPIIKRVNPFSHPVMIVSVTGNLELSVMTKLCDDIVKKKLEKSEGVAAVTISGGQKKEILVEVDRGRLDASHISLPMVVEAIKNANYDYPAGTTQGKVVEFLVRTHGRFTKISEIGKTVVQVENPEIDPVYKWKRREGRERGGSPLDQRLISLDGLAEIKESLQDKTSFSRFNGKENISIAIQKQAEANTVKVSKSVREALAELKGSLPPEFELEVIYDESIYIKEALSNMRNNIIVGGVLAFIVLFIFLGELRDALFAGLAIPVAILITLIIMYLTGFSMNMLTLAGLALSVGSMSDCSICMTDNITRHHKELNKPLIQAAVDGTNELVGAMFSSTMTNIAVFLPLLFVSGIAQQLFQGLFMVTIFTNLASLFVSVTFIPRMAAYPWDLSFVYKKMPWLSEIILTEQKQKTINSRYQKYLGYVLTHPKAVAKIVAGVVGLSILMLVWTPRVFMPKMDQGQFMVQLNMPIGTRLEVTNTVAQKLEAIFGNFANIKMAATVGSAQEDEDIEALQSHQARVAVTVDLSKGLSTSEVIEKFKARVKRENLEGGHLTYILQDSPLRSALAGGAPVEVEVKGNDLDRLKMVSDELVKKFEEDPFLYGVQTSFSLPSKETKVIVDKDRAAAYQLSVADIAKTSLIAIKGMVATEFKQGGDDIDIRVRLRKVDRENNESLRQLALRSPQNGVMVPLNDVAQITSGTGASEIRHLDQQRAFVVTAEVSGVSSAKAINRVRELLKAHRGTREITMELGGESKNIAESFSSLKYTFLLAVFLIYMIMAAQFESIMQPLIIMSTVPLSVIGVAVTLFTTNMPLSSVAALGVVILAGIVVNNGIVLIDHINGLVAEGLELNQAIIKGSLGRIRPILMTMFTAVLGSLPLAVGLGHGDELAQPLAVVTFGGLFVSTLLTLFVIPLLYKLMAEWQMRRASLQEIPPPALSQEG
ncbi:MAG: Cobalt-zinc-cadmium resistance protein CzcA [Elusimicrobia bacterium]|nr:Cobalt-zinc-cadmium resistance protein CzcA [Elusimicrobiota bacterium]